MATEAHDTHTLALATPGAGPQMRILLVGSIVASLTNPRKIFKPEPLQELADSIKASGVHQPILVRPLPASRLEETSRALRSSVMAWPFATTRKREPIEYELVAGERRWRACQLAGVAEIPAMIRELTDEQALEIQVIENLQREDVTELEEAEGYQALMQAGNINADQVGAKVGKSRSYVYGRLKILDLCQQAREALRAGKIDFSRGLLIARIPNEGLQIKALEFCTDPGWRTELPSYRECAHYVQNTFMLRLDKARFAITDASLVPAAGACGQCPKRTGANPDLFKDVDSADVCTDPACYRAKEDAHTAQVVAAAEAKGQNVIAGKEAAELVFDSYRGKLKGYRRLDSVEDSPTDKPLRSIIGKQMEAEGIKPTMIEAERKKGEFLACLPNEVVTRLLKAVEGQAKAAKTVSAEVKELVKTKEAKALEKAEAKYEQAWRDRLLDAAWAQIDGAAQFNHFATEVHRYLLRREINGLSQDDAAALANILDLGKVGAINALQEYAQRTTHPAQLHLLVIMQRDSSATDYGYTRPKNEGLMMVAGIALGDGFDAAVKEIKAQAKAEYLPKPAKSPATPDNTEGQEGASTPRPAAQASPTRAKAKKQSPAAQPAEAPKISKAHAAAMIAAELEALDADLLAADAAAEAQIHAPAAQGDEGSPAPAGGPATAPSGTGNASAETNQAPAAQGNEAQPHLGCEAAPATRGKAGADAKARATVNEAQAIELGVTVRVKDNATGKKQAPHIGKTGTVLRQIGPDAWDVSIPREKRGVPLFVCFHTTELEVVP